MFGTIILFIKEMYGNKNKNFFLVVSVFSGRAGMLTNYLFLFGLIGNLSVFLFTIIYRHKSQNNKEKRKEKNNKNKRKKIQSIID